MRFSANYLIHLRMCWDVLRSRQRYSLCCFSSAVMYNGYPHVVVADDIRTLTLRNVKTGDVLSVPQPSQELPSVQTRLIRGVLIHIAQDTMEIDICDEWMKDTLVWDRSGMIHTSTGVLNAKALERIVSKLNDSPLEGLPLKICMYEADGQQIVVGLEESNWELWQTQEPLTPLTSMIVISKGNGIQTQEMAPTASLQTDSSSWKDEMRRKIKEGK
jgi:hypothetical protein